MKYGVRKVLLLLAVICFTFFYSSDAKAISEVGQKGNARLAAKSGFHKYVVNVGGVEKRVFCVNYNVWDPDGSEYVAVSAVDLIKGMSSWWRAGESFTDDKINEYIKMMGGVQYWYTDIEKINIETEEGANTVQAAIWKVLYDSGLVDCGRTDCDSWLMDKQFGYIKDSYEDAVKWYNENKKNLDVKAVGWKIVSGDYSKQEIIEFEVKYEKNDYDYTLDLACVNCQGKKKSNISYIIQDVDNWKQLEKLNEIKDSTKNRKIKKYFGKDVGSNQICREEYHIVFPNDSTEVYVENGGYFTINEDLLRDNFKPFHVERIIQCRTNNSKDSPFTDGNTTALKNKYCSGDIDSFNAGNIKIRYDESSGTGYDPYIYEGDMKQFNKSCSVSKDSDGTAVLIISSDYKLEDNIFRYVLKGTAIPVSTMDSGSEYSISPYPNFPAHYNHKVTTAGSTAGYISVKYELPGDSNMKEVYKNATNGELLLDEEDSSKSSIYKLWLEDSSKVLADEINSITIKNSACAKMYGRDDLNSAEFTNCAKEYNGDVSLKIKHCKNQNESIGSVSDGYTCEVKMNPSDDDSECKIISTEGDGKYIGSDGKIISRGDFVSQCCNRDNYKLLGVDYNFETNTCTSSGGGDICNKYNVGSGVYAGYVWGMNTLTGEYMCCTSTEISSGVCASGDDDTCNKDTAGKGKYAGYVWAKNKSTGSYTCCTSKEIADGVCDSGTTDDDTCNKDNAGKGKYAGYVWAENKSTGKYTCCSLKEIADGVCDSGTTDDDTCNKDNAGKGRYAGYVWAKNKSTGKYMCCTSTEMASGVCGSSDDDTCNKSNAGIGKYAGYVWAKKKSTGKYTCCTTKEVADGVCDSSDDDTCNKSTAGVGKYAGYVWAKKKSTGKYTCCTTKEVADGVCTSKDIDACNKDNVGTGAYTGYVWAENKSTGKYTCCSLKEIADGVCDSGDDDTCNKDTAGKGKYAGYVWAKKTATGEYTCCTSTEMANGVCGSSDDDTCNKDTAGIGKYAGYVWAKKTATGNYTCCTTKEVTDGVCASGDDDDTCNESNAGTGVYTGYVWAKKKATGNYTCCTLEEVADGLCDSKDIDACNKGNVGTGAYVGFIWAKKRSTGKYGCCSPTEQANNECHGKPFTCVDGKDGPCGDSKLCQCDADNKCPNDHDDSECPTDNKCEHSGSSYKINGETVDKSKYASVCCNSSSVASDLGLDWNEKNGICCGEGETYNPLTGICVKSCDTCDSAELCCGPNSCGKFSKDKDYCDKIGADWDGSKCLVCHGKPKCDDPTCKDELIYRTVDLENPFIGEEGNVRNTGINWGALSVDGRFDSNADNAIVKSIFSESVYGDSHIMYKFTLDSDLIDAIRKYNSEHKDFGDYVDFTLTCDSGVNCKSGFIKNVIPNEKKSGKCLGSSTDSICR